LAQLDLLYLESLARLASLYRRENNFAEAEQTLREIATMLSRALGENNTAYATAIKNLASLFIDTGRYADAEPLLQQALEIDRSGLGQTHQTVIEDLNQLGMFYHRLGRSAAAEQIFAEAAEAARRGLGETHPTLATVLRNQAAICEAMGNYRRAETLCNQALAITKKAVGEHHPDVARGLINLATLYFGMGRFPSAFSACEQAIALLRAAHLDATPLFATALSNLGMCQKAMGRHIEAEALLRQALSLQRTTLGHANAEAAKTIMNLAAVLVEKGDYSDARQMYDEALAMMQAVGAGRHPQTASIMHNLARLFAMTGDYARAVASGQQALGILRDTVGQQHPTYAATLGNLAQLYLEMGNYSLARSLGQQVLDVLRATAGNYHPDFASALDHMAEVHWLTGDLPAARMCLETSLAVRRVVFGEQHLHVAHSLNNLAVVEMELRDYAKAEERLREALALRRSFLGEQNADVAMALYNIAVLHARQGRHVEAQGLVEQARAIFRSTLGEGHPTYGKLLSTLAYFDVARGRIHEALALMQQTEQITDRLIGQVFSIASESQRMALLDSVQASYFAFLSLVSTRFPDSPAAVQSALDLVLRRKAVGAEALAAQRDAVLGRRYPELAPRVAELTQLRRRIARRMLDVSSDPDDRHVLAAWNSRREELESELAARIPEMNLERRLRAADRHAVANALPSGSTLIELVHCRMLNFSATRADSEPMWLPARYLAFLLRSGSPDDVRLIDLGDASSIDGMIAAFRTTLTGETDGPRGRDLGARLDDKPATGKLEAAAALSAAVIGPLRQVLHDSTELFVAPDGDLNRLPMEVLPYRTQRLIDACSISYVGVGRDLIRFDAQRAQAPRQPMVLADPDFDLHLVPQRTATPASACGPGASPQREAMDKDADVVASVGAPLQVAEELNRGSIYSQRLRGTRSEGEQVAALMGVSPLLADEAVEARVKACQSPHILHMATHGFFLPDQPRDLESAGPGRPLGLIAGGKPGKLSSEGLGNPLLRSGLALAGANTWCRGGELPAEAEDGILSAEDVSGLDLLDTDLVVLSACETGLGSVRTGEGIFGLRRAFLLAGAKTLIVSLWKVPDEQTKTLMINFYQRLSRGVPRRDALRQAQLALKASEPDPFVWGAFICIGDPGALPQITI
jgi:CHAT domain-containing protein/tetratricopeptide (TPR) repeat protein